MPKFIRYYGRQQTIEMFTNWSFKVAIVSDIQQYLYDIPYKYIYRYMLKKLHLAIKISCQQKILCTYSVCRNQKKKWCLWYDRTCLTAQVTINTAQLIIPNRQLVNTLMSKFFPILGYSSIPCHIQKYINTFSTNIEIKL